LIDQRCLSLRQLLVLLAVCHFGGALMVQGAKAEDKEPERLPLYEYGVIGLASRLPHYRGSDEYSNYYFPVPYFIYRGERLKADKEGVRGIFWHNEHWQTDISLSGNPPVDGDDKAREGMPELNAIGECGPAVRYSFYDLGEWDAFYLQASLRAAFAVGFADGGRLSYEGVNSELKIAFLDADFFAEQQIKFSLSASLLWGDEQFHDYFYDVSSPYATEQRAEYDARAGYGGWWASVAAIRDVTADFSVSFYGRWLNSSGANFVDSPLVKAENNYIVGLLLIYKIGESQTWQK
jgi:outer membrane protein